MLIDLLLVFSFVLIDYQFMSQDLRRGLMGKKNNAFDHMLEDCLVKIQRIKTKNDMLQKQIGSEIEQTLNEEIHEQKEYLQKEIGQLKALMTQMQAKFKETEARNKMKQVKLDAQRQIQRNKIILKDLINRSFMRRSAGKNNNQDDESDDRLLLEGRPNMNAFQGGHKPNKKDQSMLTEEQEHIEIDYELQRKILLQKNKMIDEVEQSTSRINDIMNDMGIMVQEQGQNLDIITDELMKVNKNVNDANDNIDQAQVHQKKARKKYTCLVVIIVLAILAGIGLVIILVT